MIRRAVTALLAALCLALGLLPTAALPSASAEAPGNDADVPLIVSRSVPLTPRTATPTGLTDAGGGHLLTSQAAAAFASMSSAAARDGVTLVPLSGYRSYAEQAALYAQYSAAYGQAQADTFSARPGTSEHQTGLAIDIGSPDGTCATETCFAQTASGRWAARHAWEHGFIVRYPAGKTALTGYTYEPWHLRYIGRPAAADMHERGIATLEEYAAFRRAVSSARTAAPQDAETAAGQGVKRRPGVVVPSPSMPKDVLLTSLRARS
jgi:D-alanyl-D-alanine carboxypeptidase